MCYVRKNGIQIDKPGHVKFMGVIKSLEHSYSLRAAFFF